MALEEITAPVVEGTAADPAATEIPQTTQVIPESQDTTTNEVEVGSKEPQVTEAARRKPSDYYRERQTIRELKDTVALLDKKIRDQESLRTRPQAAAPEIPDFDPAHFSPEHKRILIAREKALRDAYDAKIASLEQRVNGWQESQVVAESERKNQEALEKLFPKSSPDSKETLQERVAKDPERAERIRNLLIDSGLNELSKINPDQAVKFALMELGENEGRQPNPLILKKSLMGGSPSGNASAGQRRASSEADLRAENKRFNDQLDKNPSLRFDTKFMERRRQILDDIERLVAKEKR